MARNRGMASVSGSVHRLNVFRFQEAAMREAIRVAKRDDLVSPWVVEVVVYNEDGPPSYLATVCDGRLVAWEEKDIEEDVIPAGEPLVLDPDRMTQQIGMTHDELEDGLASGEWIVLMDEAFPDRGRLKVAAKIESGHVVIEKWRDENEDGTWVWGLDRERLRRRGVDAAARTTRRSPSPRLRVSAMRP